MTILDIRYPCSVVIVEENVKIMKNICVTEKMS